VVVAVVAVRVVEVAVDEVIGVVTVRQSLMAAAGAVGVVLGVAGTAVLGRAVGRVGPTNFQGVLLDLPPGGVVQVAVMDVIHVAVVLDGGVAAAGAVLMIVVVVVRMAHRSLLILG
jgi:hypothetical protein